MRKAADSWNFAPFSRHFPRGPQVQRGHAPSHVSKGMVSGGGQLRGEAGVRGTIPATKVTREAPGLRTFARLGGIGPSVLASLARTANAVPAAEDNLMHLRLAEAAREARAISRHWDFTAPARTIDRSLELQKDETAGVRLRRAAVARLALDHFELAASVPESVSALFPEHFARLARYLETGPADRYIHDYYVKDVRYALGVTIPCGGLQMDLAYRIGPKLVIRHAVRTGAWQPVLSYVACGGWRPWGNHHIDLRAMNEFHPAGWTAAFLRMAEVLAMQPALRGIAGVSWFYDPALADISPSLAWLHQIPLRHGAFLLRMKTTADDIRNATIRSAARRALYDRGEYLPARHLLAWPRAAVLAWARKARQEPSPQRPGAPAAPLPCDHGGAVR